MLCLTDQYEADTLTKDELTALLRGPAGSTVEMWVGGALADGLPRKVELERRSLPQPPLKQARCCPVLRTLPGQAHDTFKTSRSPQPSSVCLSTQMQYTPNPMLLLQGVSDVLQ